MSEPADTPDGPAPAGASALALWRRFPPAWSTFALVIGVALAVASFSVEPSQKAQIVRLAPTDGGSSLGGAANGSGGGSQSSSGAGAGRAGAQVGSPSGNGGAAGLACAAGRNGGSTDVGVTASSIKLGATVVQSGIGASFLGDVRFAMQAVADKANRSGGICGRRIDLKLVDDGWDFSRGGDYLRNLVEGDKVFALAVVPSSEGLKNVSDAGYLKAHQVPVVGTDGMLISQYNDPYIWPVAASTVSTMHIMVKQAYDAGARQFGLVYESTYHFGIEGARAFNAAVRRLTNKDVDGYSDPERDPKCQRRFCGISATEPGSYSTEINTFNGACAACDFVGMLLEPTTATKWMKGGGPAPIPSRKEGGPQPLFTYDFGISCGQQCDGLILWSGYTPPLGDFLARPAVATYVNDIKAASSSADYNNSFVEGGYVGMELVVKALQATGPDLTRARLKATLDSMTFDSGLAPPLKWTPGNHFANVHMQAFSMQFKGGFNGWRDEQSGYDDPWAGQDGR